MPGWDEVERRVLAACAQPALIHEVRTRADLSDAAVASELHSHTEGGLVEKVVKAGVRFQLTEAGRARLAALTTRQAA